LKIAAILMAAGNSRRFGDANKLLAPFQGKPLITHAANILRTLSLDHLIAVVADDDVAAMVHEFEITRADAARNNMAQNIALGVAQARAWGADRVLIALADMPLVPCAHFNAVIAACTDMTPSASTDGMTRMPPACFPACYFDRLISLTGDNGAAQIIQQLPSSAIIPAAMGALADIDYRDDLMSALY
jgi:molybdenum cofactor cytidylyltransferase